MIFSASHLQYGHDFKSRVMQLQPKLYFDLGEASGATIVNRGYLGASFNGTITGTPTYQAAPLVANHDFAMTFSGSTNYAKTVSSASIGDATGVHTIGAWLKWTSTSTTLSALTLRDSGAGTNTTAPLIIICNQPTAGKISGFGFGSASVATTAATFNDGNPHLVIAAIDSGGSNLILWVDGVRIGSGAVGTKASANLALGIGANTASSPLQFFPGTIDEAFHIPFLTFTDGMALALYNAGTR